MNYIGSFFISVKRIEYFLIGLLCINFLIHIPYLSQMALDTETAYYYSARLIGDHNFNFFTPTYEEKPPLVFVFPSILLRFFPTIVWGRLQSLICATIALFYIYRIGKKIGSPTLGVYAVLLCIFYPMFMVQSIFFTDSMPETAICMATLYYALSSERKKYLIAGTIAMLTKESLALLPILIFLWAFFSSVWKEKKSFISAWNSNVYITYPLVILFCWMLLNKLFFGYMVYPGNQENLLRGFFFLQTNYPSAIRYAIQFITHSGVYIIAGTTTVLLVLHMLTRFKKISHTQHDILPLFIAIPVIYMFFYSYFFSWSLRYTLFLYPIIFLLFLRLLHDFFSVRISAYIVCICCFFFLFSQWNLLQRDKISLYGEAIDVRAIAQQAFMRKVTREIQSIDPNVDIYTDFQIAHYLWDPLFGYVPTRLNNVFQFQEPMAKNDCPTCHCSGCIYIDDLPRNKRLMFVHLNALDQPWLAALIEKSTVIKTITPDWPTRATDIYTVYEYIDPID